MLSAIGSLLALGLAAFAWVRSRRASGGYYDDDVYAMTPAVHRRWAFAGLAFAAFFAAVWRLGYDAAGSAGFALFAVVAIAYAESFLRGAEDVR